MGLINTVRLGLEEFDVPVSVNTTRFHTDFYFADYNTNVKSNLFPKGDEGKATRLYLLHILSTINFLLYVLNGYEKDDYGWWLKKIENLQEHFIQNKLITPTNKRLFDELNCKNAKYMNGTFRNYIMHSKIVDKEGKCLISHQNLDRAKPLFGLVETCFDDMSYIELKANIILEMRCMSEILSDWLDTKSLKIESL